jgi:hypothetical protein
MDDKGKKAQRSKSARKGGGVGRYQMRKDNQQWNRAHRHWREQVLKEVVAIILGEINSNRLGGRKREGGVHWHSAG